jgi:hypothetical protein
MGAFCIGRRLSAADYPPPANVYESCGFADNEKVRRSRPILS